MSFWEITVAVIAAVGIGVALVHAAHHLHGLVAGVVWLIAAAIAAGLYWMAMDGLQPTAREVYWSLIAMTLFGGVAMVDLIRLLHGWRTAQVVATLVAFGITVGLWAFNPAGLGTMVPPPITHPVVRQPLPGFGTPSSGGGGNSTVATTATSKPAALDCSRISSPRAAQAAGCKR